MPLRPRSQQEFQFDMGLGNTLSQPSMGLVSVSNGLGIGNPGLAANFAGSGLIPNRTGQVNVGLGNLGSSLPVIVGGGMPSSMGMSQGLGMPQSLGILPGLGSSQSGITSLPQNGLASSYKF